MKYIALEKGFFDGQRIPKGGKFEAEGFKGSWAKPASKINPEEIKDELPTPDEVVEAVQGKKKRRKKKS